jgi:hypothetical protein
MDKELLFTGDYNMMGSSPAPPVQGEEALECMHLSM